MDPRNREAYVRKIFVWSVLLKAFDGVIEILAGIALLFTGSIMSMLEIFIHNELIDDPNDFLATHLEHLLPIFTAHAGVFASVYLLSHGIVKIFLVVGLLREKLWAYPSAMVVFTLFILYQLYRYAHTHSLSLIILTVLDLVVIILTWHEYQYLKKHGKFIK